jgi:hypothetical protein
MNQTRNRDADAVRYMVLRKLAPGLRHGLMGDLQSIQFLAELAARLLRTGADESRMRDSIGKIPAAAGQAVATCHSIIEWLRPGDSASGTLAEVVSQCVKLAGDDWRMRGIQATIGIADPAAQAQVSRSAARELVVASLLAMTDLTPGPMDVEIVASLAGYAVELRLQWRIAARPVPFPPATTPDHALQWDDVAILAAAHDVCLSRAIDSLCLRFGLAPPMQGTPDAGADRVPPE